MPRFNPILRIINYFLPKLTNPADFYIKLLKVDDRNNISVEKKYIEKV